MKEMLAYYISPIVYGVLFASTIKILEYLKIRFNYDHVIVFTLIISAAGRMLLRRFACNGEKDK